MTSVHADSHVHLHPGFPVSAFLDHAATNLACGLSPKRWTGALFLTESRGVNRFEELASGAAADAGDWSIRPTAEPNSVRADRTDGTRLVVISGRQIVTRERLEVLGLGILDEIADGGPIEETVERVLEREGLAVLPWGFGKWWFSRGRVIEDLLSRVDSSRVFLGDNGGRLRHSPRPALFDVAERRGLRVLPGSDPLPFSREVRRVGRYGFVLEFEPDPDRPAASLLARLAAPGPGFEPIGTRAGLLEFLRNQSAMQWRLRASRS